MASSNADQRYAPAVDPLAFVPPPGAGGARQLSLAAVACAADLAPLYAAGGRWLVVRLDLEVYSG
jgi:hypothetical protein